MPEEDGAVAEAGHEGVRRGVALRVERKPNPGALKKRKWQVITGE